MVVMCATIYKQLKEKNAGGTIAAVAAAESATAAEAEGEKTEISAAPDRLGRAIGGRNSLEGGIDQRAQEARSRSGCI